MTSISIFGVPLSGNNGSASMLFGLVDLLNSESKDLKIYVYSYYPRKDAQRNEYENVQVCSGTPLTLLLRYLPSCLTIRVLREFGINIPKSVFPKEVQIIYDSDLILDIGGTTFTDAKQIKAIFSVLCILPGILLGKKQVKVSQTMGPFEKIFNRTLAKLFLSRLDLIIGRGRDTENWLRKIGLTRVTFLTDASFTMDIDESVYSHIRNEYLPLFKGKQVVGIAPNSIVDAYCQRNGKNHAAIFAEFIDYLTKEGYFVLLIPHSLRFDSRSRHNNDLFTVRSIYELVQEKENCCCVMKDYNARQFRALVSLADFFIASRFHTMISALSQKIPLNVYGWGYHKYIEVMREFDLLDFVYNYDSLEVEQMISNFENLRRNRESVVGKIEAHLPTVKKSSSKHARLIKEIVDGSWKKDQTV